MCRLRTLSAPVSSHHGSFRNEPGGHGRSDQAARSVRPPGTWYSRLGLYPGLVPCGRTQERACRHVGHNWYVGANYHTPVAVCKYGFTPLDRNGWLVLMAPPVTYCSKYPHPMSFLTPPLNLLDMVGYLVQAAGIHFPGMLSSDVSFESLSVMKPLDAWDAVPDGGKAQIYFTIFFAEVVSEAKGVHYTKGGPNPTIVFPPISFVEGMDADLLKARESRELNNGRLAMIAIMSFCAEANIHGSVPLLADNPMF